MATPSRQVIERKIKHDGSVREFSCEGLRVTPNLAVVRYVIHNPGSFATPVTLPPGSISDGWFWKRKPYSLYRIRTPGGEVVAHRFDAVTKVNISEDVIAYHDLILDWWVLPGGQLVEEDRDELEELVASGGVSAATRDKALAAASTVLSRYRHIIDDVEVQERKLKLWPLA